MFIQLFTEGKAPVTLRGCNLRRKPCYIGLKVKGWNLGLQDWLDYERRSI